MTKKELRGTFPYWHRPLWDQCMESVVHSVLLRVLGTSWTSLTGVGLAPTPLLGNTHYRIFSLEKTWPAWWERKRSKNVPLMAPAWIACKKKRKKKRICRGLKKYIIFPHFRDWREIHEFAVVWLALPLGRLSREAAAFPPRRSCARQGKWQGESKKSWNSFF